MTIQVANVPVDAVEIVVEELKKHGVRIVMVNSYKGVATCEAGAAIFGWEGDVLTVTIYRNEGHFSERMLRGGLRQLVGEVVERLRAS